MAQDSGINLLPEEGREEERKKERKKLLTLASIGILILVGALTASTYVYSAYLAHQDSDYKISIDSSSKSLESFKSVETLYRTVNNKIVRLQGLLASYPRNSLVLDDVAAFTPAGVSLSSLTFDSTGKLAVSGVATSATTFGDFVNILKDATKGGTKFANVEIVAVAGGGKQGDYRFSLSMTRKGG
jgi:Tfp pilus assembly protein PilN